MHRLRTRFAETDAMGVIHHAAYLPVPGSGAGRVSPGHRASLRPVRDGGDGGNSGDPGDGGGGDAGAGGNGREFPVLEVSVQYRRPLRFDDEVDVSLRRRRRHAAPPSRSPTCWSVRGEARATAVTVHGCVDRRGRPARLPAWVRDGSLLATPEVLPASGAGAA